MVERAGVARARGRRAGGGRRAGAFDHDSRWFARFAGYVSALVVLAALNLEVTGADGGRSLGITAAAFVAASDTYRG